MTLCKHRKSALLLNSKGINSNETIFNTQLGVNVLNILKYIGTSDKSCDILHDV